MLYKKTIVLFLVSFIGLISLIANSSAQNSCSGISEVFSLIITDIQENAHDAAENHKLVIADSTHSIADSHLVFSISPEDTAYVSSKSDYLKPATLDNFWLANQKVVLLRDYVQLKKEQFFERDVDTVSRFVKLSDIGFNRQCNQALITYSYFCGETCGHQKFTILEKKNGQWKIEEEVIISIS